MSDQHDDAKDPVEPERRDFLGRASRVAMAAGLVGGYGGFGAIAARFMYPARPDTREWQFVMELGRLRVGESLLFRAPAGETINITRQGDTGHADDFIALSSVCPHLGCQVHWEGQNDRYFCPCHNGTFDAAGVGTGGPPGDAGQSLGRYPLQVEKGLLYILVPISRFADATGEIVESQDCISGPGHDPCLAAPPRRRPGNNA